MSLADEGIEHLMENLLLISAFPFIFVLYIFFWFLFIYNLCKSVNYIDIL